MGNCVFKGFGFGEVDQEEENDKMMIKVVTSNGGIMELYAPITAHCITNEFPGHAIYHSHDMFTPPLFPNEELHAGESYYLLPLLNHPIIKSKRGIIRDEKEEKSDVDDITTCNSSNRSNLPQPTPYRMSFDNQRMLKRSQAEVFPTYNSTGKSNTLLRKICIFYMSNMTHRFVQFYVKGILYGESNNSFFNYNFLKLFHIFKPLSICS